ncbi:peroxiredoxin 1 [Nannochloropsis gaditana]|uniref:Peroxiredoxin 1 n=1 Tax=Nannochloropsis gaditana TaxID=72520 RepID=W7TIS3_9STRA|nr:peroxiredoxin 1 [Nannochloropsis gaditana]
MRWRRDATRPGVQGSEGLQLHFRQIISPACETSTRVRKWQIRSKFMIKDIFFPFFCTLALSFLSYPSIPVTLAQSVSGTMATNKPVPMIGKPAPDITAEAVMPDGSFKELSLKQYRGRYVILVMYPLDFTFVCPSELIAFSDRIQEFHDLNADVVGLSVDSKYSHLAWSKSPRKAGGLGGFEFPPHFGSDERDCLRLREGVALRGLFIIDPHGILRQITINDLPIGRDVDETLRLVQAIDFVDKHGEVCPAGWKPGMRTMKADPVESLAYFQAVAAELEGGAVKKSSPGVSVRMRGREIKRKRQSKGGSEETPRGEEESVQYRGRVRYEERERRRRRRLRVKKAGAREEGEGTKDRLQRT